MAAAEHLAAAARALEVTQQYCLQAQNAAEQHDLRAEQLEAASTHLAAIQEELQQQLEAFGVSTKQLQDRRAALEARAEQHAGRVEKQEAQLVEVLRRLGAQQIDPRLLSASSSEPKRAMLDFVDMQAVGDLRKQAKELIAALRRPLQEARALLERLEARAAELQSSCAPGLRAARAPSGGPEKPARNMPELHTMLGALLAVARHHDRLLYSLRRGEAPAMSAEELEARTAELPELASKCYYSLQRVLAATGEAHGRAARYSEAHAAATAAHATLADFGERLGAAEAALLRAEEEAAAAEPALAACAEEMGDLCGWYAHTHAAYAQLAPEVQRRRAEQARAAAAVERCRAELEAIHAAEAARRAAFEEAHGRYLPASLCPAIHAPPPRYAVAPDRPDAPLPPLETPPLLASSSSSSSASSSSPRALPPASGRTMGIQPLGQRESFRLARGAATRLASATPTNAPPDPGTGEGV
eukprot:tig00001017_g6249.t1